MLQANYKIPIYIYIYIYKQIGGEKFHSLARPLVFISNNHIILKFYSKKFLVKNSAKINEITCSIFVDAK